MTSVNAYVAGPVGLALPTRSRMRDVLDGIVEGLHAGDTRWAVAHGLTVTRHGCDRVYSDPRFAWRRALVEEVTR